MLGVTSLHGVYRAQTTIARVQPCILTDATRTECTDADPVSPAAQAGLRAGDRVVEFNGVPISSYDQLGRLIRANLDAEARITVERDGATVPVSYTHLPPNPCPRRRVEPCRSGSDADTS